MTSLEVNTLRWPVFILEGGKFASLATLPLLRASFGGDVIISGLLLPGKKGRLLSSLRELISELLFKGGLAEGTAI